jgi:parvulin-like peptidyl-prolyl isomerase
VKLLREPLFHFLIAGALLFAGYEWLNRGTPQSGASEPVRIGEGEARWLRETFASQWRRQPTANEFNGLLATLVNEEVLAREARALGLDQDDTIVRRRLAQKLTFLIEDTARIAEPGEDELRRYYAAHAELYSTQPLVSFRHVFFSPQRRLDAEADARQALAALDRAGAPGIPDPSGDPLIIADSFNEIDTQAVSSLFGPAFARDLFTLPPGSWSGPIRSSFGVHLVEVTLKREAEPRRFEDVRQTVADDWRRQKNADTKEAYLARLRQKYGVLIDAQALADSDQAGKRQAAR